MAPMMRGLVVTELTGSDNKSVATATRDRKW